MFLEVGSEMIYNSNWIIIVSAIDFPELKHFMYP